MNTQDTLTTFLDFFRDRGHERIVGSTLVPPPDDPVLFTTSGMHPLTPYLEGRPHPLGRRLVGVQRCLRTTDLGEVGDSSHLTVFEMLGSWSLGCYGGPQSLRWGYQLLRDGFGISPDRLYATVFGGDEQVGPDTESLSTWQELGVPVEVTGGDNWWSNGPTGPCGPDSEIFIWAGGGKPQGNPVSDERWMELWNHVTMRYRRLPNGSLEPLTQVNVDTGMGLERLLMMLQGTRSVFDCDLFEPWMTTLPALWCFDEHALRLLTDHLRSVIVIIGDGVMPSNTGRGYVLRRLIRRTLSALWRDDGSRTLGDLPPVLYEHTRSHFGQDSGTGCAAVRSVLLREEERFGRLLTRGRKVVERMNPGRPLTEEEYRYLHETHGLPREFVTDLMPGN